MPTPAEESNDSTTVAAATEDGNENWDPDAPNWLRSAAADVGLPPATPTPPSEVGPEEVVDGTPGVAVSSWVSPTRSPAQQFYHVQVATDSEKHLTVMFYHFRVLRSARTISSCSFRYSRWRQLNDELPAKLRSAMTVAFPPKRLHFSFAGTCAGPEA